jgi:hypothetical protein
VNKSAWRPFEKYWKGIGDSLGNAQRVLETFSATFTEYRIHFWKCLKRSGDPLGTFPSMFPANKEQGYPVCLLPTVSPHISDMFYWILWSTVVLLNWLKIGDIIEKFNNYQRLFSYFFSFQPYDFCPNSNWCDSPFNIVYTYICVFPWSIWQINAKNNKKEEIRRIKVTLTQM